MVYEIKKYDREDVELLPDVIDTPLWALIDPDRVYRPKQSDRLVCGLYAAIQKRENYFQVETPTAFGNPIYSHRCGVVQGFLFAMDARECKEGGQIVIRKNSDNRKLLVVDEVNRPKGYYESVRDNNETLAALGF